METYSFRAVDQSGKISSGTVQAKDEQDVIAILKQRGLTPMYIQHITKGALKLPTLGKSKKSGGKSRPKKIKTVDMTVFCRQLATMLKAGLPLDRAMSIQIVQTENPSMKEALTKMDLQIRQGVPMSKAMSVQPTIFS